MMRYSPRASGTLTGEAEALRDWLFVDALPLWWRVGADHALGGFFERIDFSSRPVILPRRSRVVARQAFCFCEGGRLGWQGPWRKAAFHALAFLRERFLQPDGTVLAALELNGSSAAARAFDLYDQAFALLAFAYGHQLIESAGDWRELAHILVDTLTREFGHPSGGFREDREGRLPLRANPHMHFLEAALVWLSIDESPVWLRLADGIAALCVERFIDPRSGALREFFAADWAPLPGVDGKTVEPGHHYEWAFLLSRWAELTGRCRPGVVAQLIAFADTHGIDRSRSVAVNAVTLDGKVRDPVARLWPQTERLRAYLIDGLDAGAQLEEAIGSLWRYLEAPVPGLWYENLGEDNRFFIEAAPATSLYHIVGAIVEIWRRFGSSVPSAHPGVD